MQKVECFQKKYLEHLMFESDRTGTLMFQQAASEFSDLKSEFSI